MKKVFKWLKTAPLICLCTATAPLFSLSSCSKDNEITEIFVQSRQQTIEPGETVQMLIDYSPRTAKKPQVNWEILNLPEEFKDKITINSSGKLLARPEAEVSKIFQIQIQATVVNHESLKASKPISVVPIGTTGFLGFENNEIKCLDPNKQEKIIKIKQSESNPKKYETEDYIDLFINDVDAEVWGAPIQFTPIFTPDADKNMQFYRDDHTLLGWFDEEGYADGVDTLTIPNFKCISTDYPITDMRVNFKLDEDKEDRLEFTIHFRLWQQRMQNTPGRILYVQDPTRTDDYEIKMQGEGEYICNLKCPIKRTEEQTQIYSDTLEQIACFPGPKQFVDYYITWDTSILDRRIKDAFVIEPKEAQRYTNPFDLSFYWMTGFKYTFDVGKMPLTEDLQYEPLFLFKLVVHDKWNPDPAVMSSVCTFSIEWIN